MNSTRNRRPMASVPVLRSRQLPSHIQTGGQRGGRCLIGALSAVLACASIASADTTVRLMSDGEETQIRFTKQFIRVDGAGDDGTFLFDANAKVMRVFQPSEQKYMEVTQADVEMMGKKLAGMQGQMADAMEQAKAALANLPPEQRAMAMQKLEAMSPPQAAQAAVTTTRFEKAGGSETILGVKCEKYRVFDGDKAAGEAWMATTKELGISRDDLSAFHELSTFLATMPNMAGWSTGPFAALDPTNENFVGFPMRFEGDHDMEVLAIEHEKVDSSVFSVPEGWKRMSPMDGIR
ncbi:MAG: DUF4412 domain-containing protein [Candidatus Eisenbacteria bacterium]|uniref:DUF4412 domain-containing protein n=1 Tax=Eiseniibacteriota bacterium TaxID=2212470 RepID=A0A956NEG2_UNCEI|nr:DUF4412 domain-containing protein [Candidatus Eisenbacteria bacterium]